MINTTIISLAILKANWDETGKGYLDNFVPILAEGLRLLSNDIVTLPELRDMVETQFGMRIPQNSIEAILKRCKKHGYIKVEQGIYKRNNEKLAILNFNQVRQRVLGMQESLISELINYCRNNWGVEWNAGEAESALLFYLQDNELSIVTAATYGTTIPMVFPPSKNAKYYIGSFIQHLQETKSSKMEYLETIVKGNMLANSLFLSDPNQAARKFRNTEVYFDTTLLIHALGYAGKAREEPCTELLALLYETGAELRCFKHTLGEIRSILNAISQRMSTGQKTETSLAAMPTNEYFLTQRYKVSDIELLKVRLEKDLQALRIRVVDKPAYTGEYTIDESGLDKAFGSISYRSNRARQRDVDSMSAIMRLRQGREYNSVEDCRAVFVTSNTVLAKECANFFCIASNSDNISPCLTDYTLTNLLWLKKPLAAPDLPRKRIIADCYAATQPDEKMWKHYLNEIDKLQKAGNVSVEDYYLLRYSLEAKQALMELTQGDADVFTRASIGEMLALIKSKIQAELIKQVQLEKARADEAEKSLEDLETRESERQARIKLRATRAAAVIHMVVMWIFILVLTAGLALTFPWAFSISQIIPLRIPVFILLFALLIFLVVNLVTGATVKALMRELEVYLAKHFENILTRLEE